MTSSDPIDSWASHSVFSWEHQWLVPIRRLCSEWVAISLTPAAQFSHHSLCETYSHLPSVCLPYVSYFSCSYHIQSIDLSCGDPRLGEFFWNAFPFSTLISAPNLLGITICLPGAHIIPFEFGNSGLRSILDALLLQRKYLISINCYQS